tara:strand:+ start:532 stop:795 length:264 start_codon:yes stop_codon:yes gene_type:complete
MLEDFRRLKNFPPIRVGPLQKAVASEVPGFEDWSILRCLIVIGLYMPFYMTFYGSLPMSLFIPCSYNFFGQSGLAGASLLPLKPFEV